MFHAGLFCMPAGGILPHPHAWGIQPVRRTALLRPRFIPTCVGNTTEQNATHGGTAVHPHMRGEYWNTRSAFSASFGSSPHAWGIRQLFSEKFFRNRFIPTCVGNTSRQAVVQWFAPVHPHMRGEYRYGIGQNHSVTGSSPHAWGIHHRRRRPGRVVRFIPTCVGNTG